jgi:hypothetical protein
VRESTGVVGFDSSVMGLLSMVAMFVCLLLCFFSSCSSSGIVMQAVSVFRNLYLFGQRTLIRYCRRQLSGTWNKQREGVD